MQSSKEKGIGVWGDQGNGTYRNPVLFSDYSDPDVCRVGEDYYLIASEMNFMGMQVLHSRDLVNWSLIGQIFRRLPGDPYDRFERYGRGSWAPSIRFHEGVFHVFFCTPEEGLWLATARDPAGPWTLRHVFAVEGWEDPCPYWDEEGNAWLMHSTLGAGPLILHRMAPDCSRLLDEGREILRGDGMEGPKIYRWGQKILLLSPQGGTSMGWQVAALADRIEGPYETRVVMRQGRTWINGPHQGGLVDAPNGEWWFLHFSTCGFAGRVVYLEPVTLDGEWPVIGRPVPGKTWGEPVAMYRKPSLPEMPLSCPATSDPLHGRPGLQWQWNHNPVEGGWSCVRRPGCFSVKGSGHPVAELHRIPNLLTQKLVGSSGQIRVTVHAEELEEGQMAGITLFGREPTIFAVRKRGADLDVVARRPWDIAPLVFRTETCRQSLIIGLSIQHLTQVQFFCSPDGDEDVYYRNEGALSLNPWKGTRIALFTSDGEGWASFSDFLYLHDGPCGLSAENLGTVGGTAK